MNTIFARVYARWVREEERLTRLEQSVTTISIFFEAQKFACNLFEFKVDEVALDFFKEMPKRDMNPTDTIFDAQQLIDIRYSDSFLLAFAKAIESTYGPSGMLHLDKGMHHSLDAPKMLDEILDRDYRTHITLIWSYVMNTNTITCL